jgi:hypothetical protein
MTALKQKSKDIKAAKAFKSPQSGSTEVDGSQTDSFPAETKTLPAAVEFSQPGEQPQADAAESAKPDAAEPAKPRLVFSPRRS